jgi:hypothetical protein
MNAGNEFSVQFDILWELKLHYSVELCCGHPPARKRGKYHA